VETARPATDCVIEARGLAKVLGRRRVVNGLDLAVPAGSIFGFLGPNGSGKTTTIRMLVGLIHPDGGTLRVLGHPIPSGAGTVLPRVGAVVESPA
jgi:ABC-2 type transport system ATP-binding protein